MMARCTHLVAFLAIAAAPATAHAVASAELFKDQPYRYGRFDARIRYGAGDGVVSSFFLWKVGSEMPSMYWNELDFEKLGAECHLHTNNLYDNPLKRGEKRHATLMGLCEAYHDYRFEWTPTYIAWFVDSQEIRRETGEVLTAFEQNAHDGMRVHFNIWPGNIDFGGYFDPSIMPVRQYISWAQYSSFQNGTFKVEWREEFDGAGVPVGWSIGEWPSPLNLSTHSGKNVTFSNGIAVLSLTADDATGFNGTPPPDNVGGRGGAAAGGSGNAGAPSGGRSSGGAAAGAGASSGGVGGYGTGGTATSGTGGAPQTGGGGTSNAGAPAGGSGNAGVTGGSGFGGATTGGTTAITGGASATAGSPSGGTYSNTGGSAGAASPTAGHHCSNSSGCGLRPAKEPRSHAIALSLGLLTAWVAQRRRREKKRRA